MLTLALLIAAQGFNLDTGIEFDPPPSTYGAAADQPGTWNEYGGNDTEPFALLGLDGEPTTITFNQSLPFGSAFLDGSMPASDDDALLLDYFDLHSTPHTFEVRGLAPGDYEVFTYAIGVDNENFRTTVALTDAEGNVDDASAILVGGVYAGALVEGVTHARHEVTVGDDGTIRLFTFGNDKGTLNGLQVRPIVPGEGEGEGEGEGDAPPSGCTCGATSSNASTFALLLVVVFSFRARAGLLRVRGAARDPIRRRRTAR